MIRFLLEMKKLTRTMKRWPFDFSLFFTLLAMTQNNDGIELVMCQTNERPEKHAEEDGDMSSAV
jgi:hypothetical protein